MSSPNVDSKGGVPLGRVRDALAVVRVRLGPWRAGALGVMVGLADVMNLVAALLMGLSILGRPVQGFAFLGIADKLSAKVGAPTVLLLAVAVLVTSLLRIAVRSWVELLLVNAHAEFREKMALKMFQAFMGLPYETFIEKNTAHRYFVIHTEVDRAASAIQSSLRLVAEASAMAVMAAALLGLDWRATLFSGILGGAFFWLLRPLNQKVNHLGTLRNDAAQKAGLAVVEPLLAYRVVHTFRASRWFEDRMTKSNAHYYGLNRRAAILQAALGPAFEVGVAFILMAGLALVWSFPNLAPDLLTAFLLLSAAAYRLIPALAGLSMTYAAVRFNYPGLERVMSDLSDANSENIVAEPNLPTDSAAAIEFRQVSFRYRGGNEVLQNVNLSIGRGQHIGIVGPSGAGKSTMVDLALGLLPATTGTVGIGRGPDGNRLRVGYLPQASILRDATVLENIAIGEDANRADRQRAALALEMAGLGPSSRQPFDLDHSMGEAGTRLSGGQKQRIGIARALYAQADILILDEPTASLDPETEAQIVESLQKLRHLTWIIVTHREAPLAMCDAVYELRDKQLSKRVVH